VILVLIFLVFAGLMIARILPALLAVPLMALALALGAGVDAHGLAPILSTGVVKLAPYYTTVIFGALLGRVVLSTGIAETVVNYAAEFGGDKPLALALVLCAAVAILFTSQTGLGAIIMIGSIVLPVMLTVGVPRTTAATLFLLSFALGYVLNIAQWKFYRDVFGVDQPALQSYIYVLFAIDALILVVYAIVRARTTRDYATFAIASDAPRKRVPPWALLTPVLPLILFVMLHVDALAAFAISAVYGALATNPKGVVQTLVASWIRGVEDVAPAIILMMGIGMLLVVAPRSSPRSPRVRRLPTCCSSGSSVRLRSIAARSIRSVSASGSTPCLRPCTSCRPLRSSPRLWRSFRCRTSAIPRIPRTCGSRISPV